MDFIALRGTPNDIDPIISRQSYARRRAYNLYELRESNVPGADAGAPRLAVLSRQLAVRVLTNVDVNSHEEF